MKTNKVKSYVQRLIRVLHPGLSFLVMKVNVSYNYYNEPIYIVLVSLGKKTKKEITKFRFESRRNSHQFRNNKKVMSKLEILSDVSQTLTKWTQTNFTVTDNIRLFNEINDDYIYN